MSTSNAATMPPSTFGTRRCEMTPASDAASCTRICVLPLVREDVPDAVERLRGVVGVQRREHEVAGLGERQRELDRLGVTHLADEDDVGVLTERGAQRAVERVGVEPDLALVHDADLVPVHVLDRVLDREDVAPRGASLM